MKQHDPDRLLYWMLLCIFSLVTFMAFTQGYYIWLSKHNKHFIRKHAPEIVWPPKK